MSILSLYIYVSMCVCMYVSAIATAYTVWDSKMEFELAGVSKNDTLKTHFFIFWNFHFLRRSVPFFTFHHFLWTKVMEWLIMTISISNWSSDLVKIPCLITMWWHERDVMNFKIWSDVYDLVFGVDFNCRILSNKAVALLNFEIIHINVLFFEICVCYRVTA